MAVAGAVKLEVIAKAQENIRAVLKQSNNAIKQSASELKKAGVAQTRMGAAVAKAIRGQGKFRASLIASADKVGKLGSKLASAKAAVGALGAALAAKAFADFAIEGEKAANIASRFAATAGGTTEALERMQEVTAGLVTETDLQVVANRFARLGVPIEETTRLLELSTKAAIDQGREVLDVARVVESSLKGRTTGLIDIGVNIDKITGLTQEYAKATGVAVGELDEMDRRLKVALPAALKALGNQFDAVNVDDFTLDMQQAKTATGDLLSDMQVKAAKAVGAFAAMFQTAASRVEEFEQRSERALRQSARTWEDLAGRIKTSVREIATGLRSAADAGLSSFQEQQIAWEEAGEKQALVQKQLARAAHDRAELNTRLIKQGAIRLDQGKWIVQDAEKMKRLEEAALAATEKRHKAEFDLLRSRMESRRAEAEARDAEFAVLAEQARERIAMAGGELKETRALRAAKEAFNREEKTGNAERLDELTQQVILATKAETLARSRQKSGKGSAAAAKDLTEEVRERIRLLEHANTIGRVKGDRDKLFFDRLEKERLIKREGAGIDDEALRKQFEKVSLAGLDLETAEKLKEINEAEKAIDDQRLQIARDKAAQQALEAEQRRDALAGMVGGGIGEAAGMFAELDANLERLGHPKRYEAVSRGFAGIAAQSKEIAKTTAEFGTAVGKADGEVAKGAAAALGAVQPAVAAFVEGTKERALIMMAFELAMAVAEGAAGNIPAAVGHGIAAGMFGAMAGTAATQPTTAAPEAAGGGAGLLTPAAIGGPEEQAAQRVTVNLGPGMIMGMPQAMGRAIADRINSMQGSGMESTAF